MDVIEPKNILIGGLLDRLLNYPLDTGFVFFLGAGCSRSSGIPTAGELVNDHWMPRLKEYFDKKTFDYKFPSYDERYASSYYSAAFEELYPSADQRQREIEAVVGDKFPGVGYAVLAKLMKHCPHRFRIVLTTNFDDLVQDALYLHGAVKPLVVVHESLISFVKSTRLRPTVIKLHGDARIAPKNSAVETSVLQNEVERVLRDLLIGSGLIFLGYGGADHSVSRTLCSLPPETLSGGVYWINTELPVLPELRAWLAGNPNAFWVRLRDFDQVMMALHEKFSLPPIIEQTDLSRVYSRASAQFYDSLFGLYKSDPGNPFLTRLGEFWAGAEADVRDRIAGSLGSVEHRARFEHYVAHDVRSAESLYGELLQSTTTSSSAACDLISLLLDAEGGESLAVQRLTVGGMGHHVIRQRDAAGQSALMHAGKQGAILVVGVLLGLGADVNTTDNFGKTALCLAAAAGYTETCAALLDKPASPPDIDHQDSAGYSAFLSAVTAGHTQVVEFLTSRGARKDMRLKDGGNALMLAAYSGHLDILSLLIKAGLDVNAVNTYGTTALIWAAYKGHEDIVERLLAEGAFPNIINKFGNSALLEAVYNGHVGALKALLRHGADPAAKDSHGVSALMHAQRLRNEVIVVILTDSISAALRSK